MSRPTLAQVAAGDTLPTLAFPISREHLVRYCGASGDFNTIHWNERIAREVELPDVIAHGMLTMATAVRVVTQWCGDPGAVVQYGARFTKVVPVPDVGGTELTVSGVVAVKDEDAGTVRVDLTASIPGADGGTVTVLGRARALVRLPAADPS